jgi:hypothetical protein
MKMLNHDSSYSSSLNTTPSRVSRKRKEVPQTISASRQIQKLDILVPYQRQTTPRKRRSTRMVSSQEKVRVGSSSTVSSSIGTIECAKKQIPHWMDEIVQNKRDCFCLEVSKRNTQTVSEDWVASTKALSPNFTCQQYEINSTSDFHTSPCRNVPQQSEEISFTPSLRRSQRSKPVNNLLEDKAQTQISCKYESDLKTPVETNDNLNVLQEMKEMRVNTSFTLKSSSSSGAHIRNMDDNIQKASQSHGNQITEVTDNQENSERDDASNTTVNEIKFDTIFDTKISEPFITPERVELRNNTSISESQPQSEIPSTPHRVEITSSMINDMAQSLFTMEHIADRVSLRF